MDGQFITKQELDERMVALAESIGTKVNEALNGLAKRMKNDEVGELREQIGDVMNFINGLREQLESEDDDEEDGFEYEGDDDEGDEENDKETARNADPATARRLRELERILNAERAARQSLEEALRQEQERQSELRRGQLERSRRDSVANTLRELRKNGIPIREDAMSDLIDLLSIRGLLVPPDDEAETYRVRAKVKDKTTGLEEEAEYDLMQGLQRIIPEQFGIFLEPRGGVGTNAAPVGRSAYSPVKEITEADLDRAASDPKAFESLLERAKEKLG